MDHYYNYFDWLIIYSEDWGNSHCQSTCTSFQACWRTGSFIIGYIFDRALKDENHVDVIRFHSNPVGKKFEFITSDQSN